jgi:hypothetical protein
LFLSRQPPLGQGLLIHEFLYQTQRRTTGGRTPLDEWSACRRYLYLTTKLTTDKHPCPGGIWTHNLSRRAAVDLRLRPRGHKQEMISMQNWENKYHRNNQCKHRSRSVTSIVSIQIQYRYICYLCLILSKRVHLQGQPGTSVMRKFLAYFISL